MSIYIKNMKMPKNCKECPFYWEQCGVDPDAVEEGYRTDRERHPDCPLIPVPAEHGRLIDADALRHWILTEMASLDTKEDREFVADRLANELPTIIPASEECKT